MKLNEESKAHLGHRGRMTERLFSCGSGDMKTYELLEMLLYSVIPYKDTRPVAEELLSRFGSLGRVLRATREELCEVEGIGPRAAHLIELAASFAEVELGYSTTSMPPVYLRDDKEAGDFFVRNLHANPHANAAAVYLDNKMRLLYAEPIVCPHFGSAAVRPASFVDKAASLNAAAMLFACRHSYGFTPTESEIATYRGCSLRLGEIGVAVGTFFVVEGERYAGLDISMTSSMAMPNESVKHFLERARGER